MTRRTLEEFSDYLLKCGSCEVGHWLPRNFSTVFRRTSIISRIANIADPGVDDIEVEVLGLPIQSRVPPKLCCVVRQQIVKVSRISMIASQVEVKSTSDVIVTDRGEGAMRRGTTPPLFKVNVMRSIAL